MENGTWRDQRERRSRELVLAALLVVQQREGDALDKDGHWRGRAFCCMNGTRVQQNKWDEGQN